MYAENEDTRIHYEVEGEGEPVVLLSGLGADCTYWSKAAALFPDYELITIDNRGVGSTEYRGPFTISFLSDDVVAVMDACGIKKAHVLGWSMGSHIAVDLAARHPKRVVDAVLLGTYVNKPARTQYVLGNIMRSFANGEISQDCLSAVINAFCLTEEDFQSYEDRKKTPPVPRCKLNAEGLLDQFKASDTGASISRFRSVKAPVLVIHGDKDIMVPFSEGLEALDLLTEGELMMADDCGHRIPLDRVSDQIVEFWRRHPIIGR